MSITIMEALQNANMNINIGLFALPIARKQLHNAVTLLEKGYLLEDYVEPLLEKYGEVELVPDKA